MSMNEATLDSVAFVSSYDVVAAVDVSKKGGGSPGETLKIAEELAIYGLRTSQISRLTGLPEATATRIAGRTGASLKTGREKKSLREIFRNPKLQATSSTFLFLLREQLASGERISGKHILAAAQILQLRNPCAASTIDWERMVNTSFLWQDGKISLSTCQMCGTCNLHEVGRGDSRNCVLCRLGDASTEHSQGGSAVVTPFRVTNCRGFPSEAPKPAECRQRILTILSS